MKKSDSISSRPPLPGAKEEEEDRGREAARGRPCAVTLINYWRQDREQLFLFINITGDDDDDSASLLPRPVPSLLLEAPLVRPALL